MSDETIPILRSLIENSINFRWIVNKDTRKRLSDYLDDLVKPGFGEKWACLDLYSRMKELGFQRSYYDFVVRYTYSHSHGNAKSIFSIHHIEQKPFDEESICAVVAQMLGHILRGLEKIYKEYQINNFSHEIWSNIEVNLELK